MKKDFLNTIKDGENNSKIKIIIQFIKFALVGASNTIVSLVVTYLVMFIMNKCFGIDTNAAENYLWVDLATFFGFLAGVINSFVLNGKFVFKGKQETSKSKTFAKVFICYGGTYLLSLLIMNVLLTKLHIPGNIAPIPRFIITIPLNFIANKLWAYKDK